MGWSAVAFDKDLEGEGEGEGVGDADGNDDIFLSLFSTARYLSIRWGKSIFQGWGGT